MSTKGIRCAIYTRESNAEGLDQAFNSLDAQREAGLDYVKSQKHEGWTVVRARYDDGGYSGATMQRPALERLFEDIESGAIDVVVVYKVDRLSRSLGDFAQMMQRFDQHGVYIKKITSRNVAPAEIYFTYRDESRRHTLADVMSLREEAWFRRGVALSEECNRHIAQSSIQRCRALREETGTKHQIIAAACSVDHARQVRAIYEECGLLSREIYSEMDDEEKEQIIGELRSGLLDCIVQVQMLGEGFDHPRLSVAAIFRPFRSLAPFVQFVGRIMRVIHENDPDHPANHGFIVPRGPQ